MLGERAPWTEPGELGMKRTQATRHRWPGTQ